MTGSASSKDKPMLSKMVTSQEEDNPIPTRILALYKFVSPNIQEETLKEMQTELDTECRKYRARGTILIAPEGINGTICYPFHNKQEKDPLLDFLQSKFDNALRIRLSQAECPVFARLKIKVKSEIVTLHQENCCPAKGEVGIYVKPNEWNKLLEDPDCLVIDTRNDYEFQVGTFRRAVNPHTQSFIEFPEWMEKNISGEKTPKKIAMFCTGGIRCEKATNVCQKLISNKDVPVYHLEGGILAYLDDVPPEQSLFDGECYVFDRRVAVTHGNRPSSVFVSSCHACRHPLSKDDLQHADFVEGLSCSWCVGTLTEAQKARFAQRQRQIELARKKGTLHIHDPKEQQQQQPQTVNQST